MFQDSDFSISSSFEQSGISVISLSRCSLALSLLVRVIQQKPLLWDFRQSGGPNNEQMGRAEDRRKEIAGSLPRNPAFILGFFGPK